ncbi:MAG: hypothetical protein ACJ8FY_24400 [Gemmataceae bacterium]
MQCHTKTNPIAEMQLAMIRERTSKAMRHYQAQRRRMGRLDRFYRWFSEPYSQKRMDNPLYDPLLQTSLGVEVQINVYRCGIQQSIIRYGGTQANHSTILFSTLFSYPFGPKAVRGEPRFCLLPSAAIRKTLVQIGFQSGHTNTIKGIDCKVGDSGTAQQ